jgi:hypothetical protein
MTLDDGYNRAALKAALPPTPLSSGRSVQTNLKTIISKCLLRLLTTDNTSTNLSISAAVFLWGLKLYARRRSLYQALQGRGILYVASNHELEIQFSYDSFWECP